MPRTRDPALEEERRQRAALATEEALAEGSWSRVTLDDIARRAGLSKGSITYWFPSKEALFLETLSRYHQRYEAIMAPMLTTPESPIRERVERLLKVALPDQKTVAAEIRFQIEIWSYAKEHPDVLQAVKAAYDRFRGACEALVALAVAEKVVTRRRAKDLYRYIHALIDGVSLHIALDPDYDVGAARKRLLGLIEDWLD